MEDQVATMEFTEEGEHSKKANSRRGNLRTKGASNTDEKTMNSSTETGDFQVTKVVVLSDQKGGERQGNRKVSELAGMFERNKMLVGPSKDAQQKPQREEKNLSSPIRVPAAGRTDKASPPPVASKPKRRPTSQSENQALTSDVAEFAYISRTSGQLFHVS